MKICPKCGEKHEKPGTFCSRSCANSRTDPNGTWKAAISVALKSYHASCGEKERKARSDRGKALARFRQEQVAAIPWEELKWTGKRNRVYREQEGKCLSCERNEWMGRTLVLEIHHIDGNKANDARENLQGLCPNCHSVTPQWRRKNAVLV